MKTTCSSDPMSSFMDNVWSYDDLKDFFDVSHLNLWSCPTCGLSELTSSVANSPIILGVLFFSVRCVAQVGSFAENAQLINESAAPCHLHAVPSGVQHTLGSAQTIPTMLLPVQPLGITRTTVPRQKLNSDAFQAYREITSGEEIVYCLKTNKHINVNDDQQVRNAVQGLTQLKKDIKEKIRSYIIHDILRTSTSLTLPDGTPIPNRRMDDLCEVWSNNVGMAECMWNILIKQYEDIV
jgi:hypothetical protein